MEPIIILLLVVFNGVFSMVEMAVISSRKARLRQRADEGRTGAATALELAENPHDFLSTVQVGITVIGTLASAFGGATISEKLTVYLRQFPAVEKYAESISIGIVVVVISYLSLIIGELVPKNLALANAESIASAVAPAMRRLSNAASPIVRFLTFSTKIVMAVLPFKAPAQAPVTEEEVKVLIEQGTEHGTFHEVEQEMVEGVFNLGDRKLTELMQPRGRVTWLDAQDSWEINRRTMIESHHSRFPLADGDLDQVIGVLHLRDLFRELAENRSPDLVKLSRKPLLVPETTRALDLLTQFRESGQQIGLVVNEHGGVEGIITLTDLVEAVVGDLHSPSDFARAKVTRREDGSWLLDGSLPVSQMMDELEMRVLPGEGGGFTTVGGLMLANLGRVPGPGEHFVAGDWRFEVLDMDGNRVDKVLASKIAT